MGRFLHKKTIYSSKKNPRKGKIMGSESSKLNSGPNIWYKMGKVKAKGKEPRMLKPVVHAIKDLKENSGSTQSKIVQYIQTDINAKNITPKPRAVVMQVKSALKYGVTKGILKKLRGRFQLALERQNLNRKNNQAPGGLADCSGRGRKGKRGGRRRQSRRRRSGKGRKRTQKATLSTVKKTIPRNKVLSATASVNSLDFDEIIEKYE